jgi:SAM-dependent methyltransferase
MHLHLIDPAAFRAALAGVPAGERDAYVDRVFGLGALPDDDPALPRGCVPYLPCAVDTLLRLVEHARIGASDVVVDVGAGVGRAAALVHLLTGARVVGIEIQPALAATARALAARLELPGVTFIEADAAEPSAALAAGSVFFLYCPFNGDRLRRFLATLEPLARARPVRVCCVDLPLPPCDWLTPAASPAADLTIYRSR